MRKNQSHQTVELSALLVDLEGGAPSEIKLVPCGSFRSARDNRPVGLSAWVMNDDCATAILSAQAQLQSKFLVDYDHQTLHAATSGTKALAAGWGGSLEWREGDGLYAVDMDWNEAALSAIAAKEYRYISPVIKFDSKTGRVTGVPMAALTNFPALDNLNDLAAAAALLFSTSQETTMDKELLALLCAVLGMPDTATTAELSGELDKIKTQLTTGDGATVGLSALLSTKADEIAALSAQVGAEPDPFKYAPVAVVNELRSALAALSSDTLEMQVMKIVDEADLAGKFKGLSEKAYAIKKGMKDIAALQADLDNTVGFAALKGMQSGGIAPIDAETAALSATTPFKVPDGGYTVEPGAAAKHNKILAYAQANNIDYPTAAKAVGA